MSCGSIDTEVAPASDRPVVVVDIPFEKNIQNPEKDLGNDYNTLHFQWICVVSRTHIFLGIRIRTEHTCQKSQNNKSHLGGRGKDEKFRLGKDSY